MKFDIITIFPNLFSGFLNQSLLARAQKKKIITIKTHDLRRWTNDKHKTVDDRPYGGGAGMVLKPEPIYRAVVSIKGKVLRGKKNRIRTEIAIVIRVPTTYDTSMAILFPSCYKKTTFHSLYDSN